MAGTRKAGHGRRTRTAAEGGASRTASLPLRHPAVPEQHVGKRGRRRAPASIAQTSSSLQPATTPTRTATCSAARRAHPRRTARVRADALGIGGRPSTTTEDAWQRAVELLFERLAVRWTIEGAPIVRQRELLMRFRRPPPRSAPGYARSCASTALSTFPTSRRPDGQAGSASNSSRGPCELPAETNRAVAGLSTNSSTSLARRAPPRAAPARARRRPSPARSRRRSVRCARGRRLWEGVAKDRAHSDATRTT